jgi:hypothetical protein
MTVLRSIMNFAYTVPVAKIILAVAGMRFRAGGTAHTACPYLAVWITAGKIRLPEVIAFT